MVNHKMSVKVKEQAGRRQRRLSPLLSSSRAIPSPSFLPPSDTLLFLHLYFFSYLSCLGVQGYPRCIGSNKRFQASFRGIGSRGVFSSNNLFCSPNFYSVCVLEPPKFVIFFCQRNQILRIRRTLFHISIRQRRSWRPKTSQSLSICSFFLIYL